MPAGEKVAVPVAKVGQGPVALGTNCGSGVVRAGTEPPLPPSPPPLPSVLPFGALDAPPQAASAPAARKRKIRPFIRRPYPKRQGPSALLSGVPGVRDGPEHEERRPRRRREGPR